MYDMYPDRWADTGSTDRGDTTCHTAAERPHRRARRAHETSPDIIRVRQQRQPADR